MIPRMRAVPLCFLVAAAASVAPLPAAAHETWLTAVVPAPAPAPPTPRPAGAKAKAAAPAPARPQRPGLVSGDSGVVELCTGGKFPVSDSAVAPERVDRTFVRFGAGRPMPMTGAKADGTVTRLEATYAGSGLAVLGVALHPKFIELAPAEFDAYLEEIGATAALEERRRRKETKRPGREVYTKTAKAFALVAEPRTRSKGAAGLDGAAEPLGLPLEFVVSGNPLELRAGGSLSATLVRDGRPLGGQAVRVLGEDGVPSLVATDEAGRVSVPLAREGRLLLAATSMRRTTKEDRKRGDAFKKAEWESVWASLQVRVLPAPPAAAPAPTPKARKKR